MAPVIYLIVSALALPPLPFLSIARRQFEGDGACPSVRWWGKLAGRWLNGGYNHAVQERII